jgi:hypothetical protein
MSGSPMRWLSDSDTPSDEDNHPERRRFWERDESPPKPRPRARRPRADSDSPPPASPLPADDSPPLAVSGEEVEARFAELERLEARDLRRAKKKAKKRAAKKKAMKRAAKKKAKRAADDDGAAGTSAAKKQKME